MNFTPGSSLRKLNSMEFMEDIHKGFRKWFFKKFNKTQQNMIQDLYYMHLNRIQDIEWFERTFSHSISVLENYARPWEKVDGSIISSVHPPAEDLQVRGKDDKVMKIIHYCCPSQPTTDITPVINQNNFTNLNLSTISKQLNRIENKIQEKDKISTTYVNKTYSSEKGETSKQGSLRNFGSFKDKTLEPTNLRPPMNISNFNKMDREFIDTIIGRMKGLSLNVLGDNGYESEFSDISLGDIQNNFQNNFGDINKLDMHKNYYPRNTPIDIDFEDEFQHGQYNYDGSSVYEWNIDGFSEYQIRQVIRRMFMYGAVVKAKGNTDRTVAKLIINGFTGWLQG